MAGYYRHHAGRRRNRPYKSLPHYPYRAISEYSLAYHGRNKTSECPTRTHRLHRAKAASTERHTHERNRQRYPYQLSQSSSRHQGASRIRGSRQSKRDPSIVGARSRGINSGAGLYKPPTNSSNRHSRRWARSSGRNRTQNSPHARACR